MISEIGINDFENVRIGQVEDIKAGTGCTVFVSEKGVPAGLDVRGGGPASRESELLKPLASAQYIHAIVLGGGSAFGLDAAGGVMEYLRKKDIGFDVGVTKVPLVCQSDIFDLSVGDSLAYPTHQMGFDACANAFASEHGNYKEGSYGAGCGATVGKIKGMSTAMKTGTGFYGIQVGNVKVGALVVLNALGDIYDWKDGSKVAGLLSDDGKSFASTEEVMFSKTEAVENKFTGNTTIGIIMTNGKFDKSQLCKIAGMAHNGYARSIRPVHTSADGDSIYAVSTGNVNADSDLVGTIASEVMSEAILRAVKTADSAYGIKAYKDL